MSEISARDALDYATQDEFLKLYGVLVGGWTLTLVGQSVAGTALNSLRLLVGLLVALAGVLAAFVAVVAVARKVLVER